MRRHFPLLVILMCGTLLSATAALAPVDLKPLDLQFLLLHHSTPARIGRANSPPQAANRRLCTAVARSILVMRFDTLVASVLPALDDLTERLMVGCYNACQRREHTARIAGSTIRVAQK